jgi:hypothetical protein
MRILLILVLLTLAGLIGAAVYFRTVSMPPEVWDVDPARVTPPASPNFALLRGAEAPLFGMAPDVLGLRIEAIAMAEGAERIAGDPALGQMTYVLRSRLMGFPDAVSIRLVPVEGGTRMEIFSRSRFGYSDMGVNGARVARWIAALSGP